ncbi:MAG: SpaH/EbpB family LPXTG-anchored major pilin [Actinomycetia bacterium]|nr:SpaH/EbpB family LPXTG-anchored major pilin [Actinomycetes bacterium]
MKATRKKSPVSIVTSVALACMLMSLFALPLFADPLVPEHGDLYIHKIIGTEGTAGDGTTASAPNGGTPANGVVFDIYKVDTTTAAGAPEAGKVYRLNGSNLEVYADISAASPENVYPVGTKISVTTAGSGASGGVAKAAGLDQGIYLVIEDLQGSAGATSALDDSPLSIEAPCAPFLVAVPMTSQDGSGWLDEVHVYPKNQILTISKVLDDYDAAKAVAVGDTIPYAITASVPGDIANSISFKVTDKLDDALDFNDDVVVKGNPGGVTFVDTTDYTVDFGSSRTVVVALTAAGMAKAASYSSLVVSFSTTVNDKIYAQSDPSIQNNATADFENHDGVEITTDTGDEGPKIHTAYIDIDKVDQAGGALAGARFKVATSAQNAADGKFLRMDATGKLIDVGGAGWGALGSSADYTVTSDVKGSATFKGLRDFDGTSYNSYYVVEVAAPAGYNMLTAPEVVTFSAGTLNFTESIEVINSQGFVLPNTGGMGTIVFTVAGIAILGIAVIVALTRKKKSTDSQVDTEK